MSSSKALAPGSLVLITGINGYVGGHVADLLLRSGYKVRGTARDQAKVDIATKAFAKYPGQFEGVLIKDITTHDAFAEIVKGVDGVVHVASDVSFGFDPTQVVTPIVNAMNNALTAANEEKSVKRFVYTSSIIAAVQMASPEGTYVNADSWNESAVDQAWVEPYTQENAVAVYAASKVEAERAAWKFLQEKKPHFVINSVLPGLVLGPNAFEGQNLATSGWIKGIYNGDEQAAQTLQSLPPIWTVDVRDIARLHVAALLEPDVVSQRILAVADSNNYGSLVAGLKQVDPSRTGYPAGPASEGFDKTVYDTALGAKLLQRFDRPGFTHTQETLRDQIAVAN